MKRLLVLFILLAVAACSPSVNKGYVTRVWVVPAHNESYIMPMFTGESCEKAGSSEICTPHYLYIPEERYVPDECFVTLSANDHSQDHAIQCSQEPTIHVGDLISLGGS